MLRKPTQNEQLDETTASQMLDNIFQACEVEPNSVPLATLTSYSNYRTARYKLQKWLLGILIALFCMMPLLFVNPKLSLDSQANDIVGKPSYRLTVSSLIPISRITATINGMNTPVYETGDNTYTIEPTQNGELNITVVLKNHQSSSLSYQVSGVDTTVPTLLSSSYKNGKLVLYLSDTQSGIDYNSIYAVSPAGNKLYPDSTNETDNYITFDCKETSLNIFIPDKTGNTLQLLLTIK